MKPSALLLLLSVLAACAHAQVTWDFEDPELKWRPRSDAVKLELVEGRKSKHALRIAGSDPGNWNYALSETHPMKAGQLYRLTVWMRVDELGEGTAAPAVKCEFVPLEPGKDGGRAVTMPYSTVNLRQWQKLTAEFMAPEGTGSFWLAVEKNGQGPMQVDLRLDDVLVEPIDELSIHRKYTLDPLPEALQRRKGVHPRLYLDGPQVEQLRNAVTTTHAAQWEKLQALADRLVKSGPPKYIEHDKYSGDEQLWQREVGNAMPTLALCYLITEDAKYLDSARAWALTSCSYPTWGLGRIDGMDLATGHQLFGLGIVYDWCHEGLGSEARQTIRETLQRRAGAMYTAAASGQVWWPRSYLQNHLWVNAAGLAVAGLALYDEVPEANRWIGLPLDKFTTTMQMLGPDGASHEGVGYWQYGVEYMLKFMVLAKELLGVDLFGGDWWRNTAAYALYLQLPRQAWTLRNNIVDIADCPRGNWYGPEYLLWKLAGVFDDPQAQWQANEEFAAGITAPGAPWLNLLWYDPAVTPRAPTAQPTLRHFGDIGIVSARSDWTGDESLLVFKCGPFLGHEAVKKLDYDAGGGHVHPDGNHFVLFGSGEWLIRDDGYAMKWTGHHNTLLVDGKGQTGEGRWFAGAPTLRQKDQVRVPRADSAVDVDHIVGDASAAYPAISGLKRYQRHLIFLKPDVLIVLDDIICDREKDLELRFHPEQQQAAQDGSAFICRGEKSVLRVEPLAVPNGRAAAEMVDGQNRDGQPMPMFTIRLQGRQERWRTATALSWSAAGAEPVPVTLQADGEQWLFIAFNRSIVFDWKSNEVIIPEG